VRVLQADNGRTGIDLVRSHHEIDLVVMDVMMAGMDGYAAMEAIRKVPHAAGVPIIVVTAKAMPGDRAEALAAGADDYVSKPVDADQLVAKIRQRLDQGG
jgi:CheY-like chemotaxis protein